MEFVTIFLIAVSLAMDAFAVSISNGVSVKGFGKKEAATQGLYFGGFQFLMPVIGWFLGSSVKTYIESVDHWIAFVLLAIIGGNMIRESFGDDEEESGQSALTAKVLLLQAVATSIDALAGGHQLCHSGCEYLVGSRHHRCGILCAFFLRRYAWQRFGELFAGKGRICRRRCADSHWDQNSGRACFSWGLT